jgi:hypothetical protein
MKRYSSGKCPICLQFLKEMPAFHPKSFKNWTFFAHFVQKLNIFLHFSNISAAFKREIRHLYPFSLKKCTFL